MKKPLFFILCLFTAGLAQSASMLPADKDLVFKFDYSSDSDTPSINPNSWGWTHYDTEKPDISNGVATFINGGPITGTGTGKDATGTSHAFNTNNFTMSFDIGSVEAEQQSIVFGLGDGKKVEGTINGFFITATKTSISLWNATTDDTKTAKNILTATGLDLSSTNLTSIAVINNETGSYIYSGDTLLASSQTHITGGEVNSIFNIGSLWNGANNIGGKDNSQKLNGKLDNVALYSTLVPEPTTVSLSLIGLTLLMARRRR
ncbi:MAG: PEP-CTERM sorting domain-containing protein [Akkermansia sp.]